MLPIILPAIAAAAGYAVIKTLVDEKNKKNIDETRFQGADLNALADNMRDQRYDGQHTNTVDQNVYDDFFLPMPDPWVPAGQEVMIQRIVIKGGLFSSGDILPDRLDRANDPSLINPALAALSGDISKDSMTRQDADYSQMSRAMRHVYLQWLASDRSDNKLPVPCRWCYLYGLERRLLIDGPKRKHSTAEQLQIFHEIKRIGDLFQNDAEFTSAVNKILCIAWALDHHPQYSVTIPNYIDFTASECTELFPWYLSSFAMQHRPVPAGAVLTWYLTHPNITVPQVVLRHPQLYRKLFYTRYQQMPVLNLTPSHMPLIIRYTAANPAVGLLTYNIPGCYSAFNQLHTLKPYYPVFEECCNQLKDLDQYEKTLNGKPLSKLAELCLIPQTIRKNKQTYQRLHSFIEGSIVNNFSVIDTQSLLNIVETDNIPTPDRDIHFLENLLQELGYYFAPDSRYHDTAIERNSIIVITPARGVIKNSPMLHLISLIIRLGAVVAQIDNDLSNKEIDILQDFIISRKLLSSDERASLLLWLHWCLHTPQNIDNIAGHIPSSINAPLKSQISHLLIAIACADGIIDPREKEAVAKLYAAIGLDERWIDVEINEYAQKHAIKTEEKRNLRKPKIVMPSKQTSTHADKNGSDEITDKDGVLIGLSIDDEFNKCMSQITEDSFTDIFK